ncbi:type VII secretion protein EccE [Mycobacterium koreense]|nr:type VII secretion protein EccE [Mycolicibacillus koreensis]MCV7247875.1 type VII secretion protein EccE [Mycolicibacillus koreensis]ODR03974.1 type VII secretion protein EccE [Mycolicibacillus koreensis]BBY52985.1 type VII secretion protein EccE [Mycolicibacillus koreensis]
MKAQSPLGLVVSWPPLAVVFLVDVGIMTLVSNWPTQWRRDIAWWTGVGIAALVAILVLVTFRRVRLGVLIGTWLRNFFTKVEPALAVGRDAATDHRRRYGHATVGVRHHDGAVVAVVAVAAPVLAPNGRHSQPEAAMAELPIQAVAASLSQFDVHLDGIDVIALATADATPTERQPSAWLVLRMTPTANVGGVIVRDSVASTMAAVAERVADDLGRRRFDAWPLTADELSDLDDAVLGGVSDDASPRLRFLKRRDGDGEVTGYATSFWLSPNDITADTLADLWDVDADLTVIGLRLLARHNQIEVCAWVRFHTAERLDKSVFKGLNRLAGRQLLAVAEIMPVPARQPRLVLPARALQDDDPAALPLPEPVLDTAEAGP